MSQERVQVIDRSIDLLEALSDGPRSLTEVCRVTGLSKGTAFRLLGGLAVRGVVIKDPVGSMYMLGPGLLRLVQGAITGIGSITTLGRTALQGLSDETGETISLHVQSGLDRVVIDEVPSRQSIRYSSLSGTVAPIHIGASSVVLLAFAAQEQRERTLALLETVHTNVDRAALEAKIEAAQRNGWSISVGERVAGASGISVPVRSSLLLLSLSVLGPTSRVSRATLKTFLPSMQQTAEHLVAVLDAQTPLPLESAS